MTIVSEEKITKALWQYNPWWRMPSAVKESAKPRKRLAFYEAMQMLRHESIRRFVVLSGVRRVGKTTILYQLIDSLIEGGVNPRNILYVSFENPILQKGYPFGGHRRNSGKLP